MTMWEYAVAEWVLALPDWVVSDHLTGWLIVSTGSQKDRYARGTRVALLRLMGGDGWELVSSEEGSLYSEISTDRALRRLTFKRPLPPEPVDLPRLGGMADPVRIPVSG